MSATNPGWYGDPTRRHENRYWDGASWTDHVADRGIQSFDTIVPSASVVGLEPATGWWLASDGKWYPPESGAIAMAASSANQRNGMAITALAIGIGGCVMGLIPILAIPALVCGGLAILLAFSVVVPSSRAPAGPAWVWRPPASSLAVLQSSWGSSDS